MRTRFVIMLSGVMLSVTAWSQAPPPPDGQPQYQDQRQPAEYQEQRGPQDGPDRQYQDRRSQDRRYPDREAQDRQYQDRQYQDRQGQDEQNQDREGQDRESQARGVARVSIVNGEVSVKRGDANEIGAAAINAPVMSQDSLLTSGGSRAELQFDSSNMLRVGQNSEVRIGDLAFKRYQIQIAGGTVTFRVLRDSDAQIELSTPSVSVRPMKRGSYRVTVRPDNTVEVTVRSGEAEIFTPRGSERLRSGQTMTARGDAANPQIHIGGAVGTDDWDRWNEGRDHDLERSSSYQHVSQDIYGAEDLDNHGTWVDSAQYGSVWAPRVSADWAPYREGRWTWLDYYGWTWVSTDPWGWAPYHYGSWFHNAGVGWCWYPGAARAHYIWRPALVAFFGFGGYGGFHAGVGFGYGNIGWVPLAPFEAYHPWYGRGFSGGYRGGWGGGFGNTRITNININNVYRNANAPHGVMGVNSNSFGRGSLHGNSYVNVSRNDMQRASLVRGQVPLAPSRESLRVSDRQVRGNFQSSSNTRFYSRQSSSSTQSSRVPFEQQRQSVEQSARHTFGGNQAGTSGGFSRGEQSNGSFNRGGTGVNSAPNSDHRFGSPAQHTQASASSAGESGGSRRFGGSSSGNTNRPNWSSQEANRPPQARSSSRGYEPQSSRPAYESSRNYSGGSSQPVRISPRIVESRPSDAYRSGSYSGSTSRPSFNNGGSRPSSNSGGSRPASSGASRPASNSGGGSSSRSSSGHRR